jgi:hypothetical protein
MLSSNLGGHSLHCMQVQTHNTRSYMLGAFLPAAPRGIMQPVDSHTPICRREQSFGLHSLHLYRLSLNKDKPFRQLPRTSECLLAAAVLAAVDRVGFAVPLECGIAVAAAGWALNMGLQYTGWAPSVYRAAVHGAGSLRVPSCCTRGVFPPCTGLQYTGCAPSVYRAAVHGVCSLRVSVS